MLTMILQGGYVVTQTQCISEDKELREEQLQFRQAYFARLRGHSRFLSEETFSDPRGVRALIALLRTRR